MINKDNDLPITRQCELLGLNRSTVYYRLQDVSERDLKLMRRIDGMHLKRPFYGSRRIRDWYSRKVLSWRLSNSMDTDFCIDGLEEALSRYGCPEIFNTDQGAQFTSEAFRVIVKSGV